MERLPAFFVGHGSPMNALASNAITRGWRAMAEAIPKPRAIVSVSAHWYAPGGRVTANQQPRTIHDFGGFPRPLYEVQYPAPGMPELAARVRDLLVPKEVDLDLRWGLDHGTWSVLVHMYPDASVPVIQLGLDETLAPEEHFALARRLRPLRTEGILVLGSGNVVHNLHAYAWGDHRIEPYDWGVRFEQRIRELMAAGDFESIARYEQMGQDAILSAPMPDHFLPLLYALAQAEEGDQISFPVEGFDGGAVSMLCVRVG
jgi:4,5-DOPA dioxygenase extradiol